MIAVLARPSMARLARTPRAWLPVVAWCSVAAGAAALAHWDGWVHGADRVLVGAFGGLALPFLAYAVVGGAIGPRGLSSAVAPLVAFGARPARAALAAIAVSVITTALVGAALGALVAALAHGVSDPPRARDALTSAYAGALGGAAYAAWFSWGASLTRRGGGRALLLGIDWILGANNEAVALLTPRAHVRNLLGGDPPAELAQRLSAVALVVLVVACVALAAWRASVRARRA